LRTFSKAFGLAGLRIGYLLTGNRPLKSKLEGYNTNFPVTHLSIEAALESLEHLDYLKVTRRRVRERLDSLYESFSSLNDVSVLPTNSCIYLVRHKRLDAIRLRLSLETHGIITAGIPGESRASHHYIRVTLGKEAHNRRFIDALDNISEELDNG
jgi:histidinol-phosphate aminotransferase